MLNFFFLYLSATTFELWCFSNDYIIDQILVVVENQSQLCFSIDWIITCKQEFNCCYHCPLIFTMSPLFFIRLLSFSTQQISDKKKKDYMIIWQFVLMIYWQEMQRISNQGGIVCGQEWIKIFIIEYGYYIIYFLYYS